MLLTYCPNCHSVFKSVAFQLSPFTKSATFSGCKESCIICRFPGAKILDGTYGTNEKGVLQLISGPAFTKDILEKLKDFVIDVSDKKYTNEEIVDKAKKISSIFGLIADWANKNGGLLTLIGLLLPAIQMLLPSREIPVVQPIYNSTTHNHFHAHADTAQIKKGSKYTPPKKKRKKKK